VDPTAGTVTPPVPVVLLNRGHADPRPGKLGHRRHRPRLEVATFHGSPGVVNHFGAHNRHPEPLTVISWANGRVSGAPPGLTYYQLLPAARKLMAVPKVGDHYAARYGIVVCDELQDTDADERAFLQAIAPSAVRMLLGDANQCGQISRCWLRCGQA
jgi:hypothetical protein